MNLVYIYLFPGTQGGRETSVPGLTPAGVFPCLKLWVGLGTGSKVLQGALWRPTQEPITLPESALESRERAKCDVSH